LQVFNANIKDLQDAPGSEYFTDMRQKTLEGTINQSKIDVSDAKLKGTTGEKEREGRTRTAVADVEATTVVFENIKKEEILKSDTSLKITKVALDRNISLADLQE
jgi:flotillin